MFPRSTLVLATALFVGVVGPAFAQGHVDVRVGASFGPPRGSYVRAVPRESVHMVWGGGHYWYGGGVWYRPYGRRYVVIAPPVGVIVPVLPPYYDLRIVGGSTYYYANGAYYASVPGQGYAVVDPPPGVVVAPDVPSAMAPSSQPVAPSYGASDPSSPYAAPSPVASAGRRRPTDPIVYPRNNHSPEQTARDRGDCARWATGQAAGTSGPEVYLRAFDACMDGRGYTVR